MSADFYETDLCDKGGASKTGQHIVSSPSDLREDLLVHSLSIARQAGNAPGHLECGSCYGQRQLQVVCTAMCTSMHCFQRGLV